MLLFAVTASGFAGNASAILLDRGPDMVYDTALNITWTRNANLPGSSFLTWAEANTWAANLVHAGYDDWRLATIDVTSPLTIAAYSCGSGTAEGCATRGNELGYMYWYNLAAGDNTGSQMAVGGQMLGDIQRWYWSATEVTNPSNALLFDFQTGFQGVNSKTLELSAWAVRDGDVGAQAPEPGPLALLVLGLAAMGFARRKAI